MYWKQNRKPTKDGKLYPHGPLVSPRKRNLQMHVSRRNDPMSPSISGPHHVELIYQPFITWTLDMNCFEFEFNPYDDMNRWIDHIISLQ